MSYDVDPQQFERGITITGEVGGDCFQAKPIADGLCHEGLVLDDQYTHADSMLRADAYRRCKENHLHGGNATLR